MTSLLASSGQQIDLLLVLGGALFLGTAGARLLQWLHFPQVLGYILIGLAVGQTGLGVISEEVIERLAPFNFFALGIIGFMIGGELHRDVFKRFGRQFVGILLAESITAFLLVGLMVGATTYVVARHFDAANPLGMSIAFGLVLGAISAATAPAATVRVLKEYRTRGPLTSTVYAIVAMDDALGLVLFGVASSIALRLTGGGAEVAGGGVLATMGHTAFELLGGVALGVAAGVVLNWILRRGGGHSRSLAYTIGALTLVTGLASWGGVDTILAAMALGTIIANLAPRRSGGAFEVVEGFAPPIYVLFFVLVGAHLRLAGGGMAPWLWAIVGVYVLARSTGKILGANLGARWTGAPKSVRRYLGMCLFCQGGVAVGLALLAQQRLADLELPGGVKMGTAVITIVIATTFIVEILGPPFVKVAAQKAGEAGLDVTEEDLMASYKVTDVVDRTAPTFRPDAPVSTILKTIADTDALTYPVVSADDRLVGLITLADLRQSFAAEDMTAWVVAFDLMKPPVDIAGEHMPLADAVDLMTEQDLDCLPVLDGAASAEGGALVGMLELRRVNRAISQEIVRRRQLAEAPEA